MANQVIVTNTGNVQVALTPPPNVQVQISRAAIGTVSNVPTANFANYAGNVTIANQPNITSLGTLSNLSVSGNSTVNNLTVTGNLSAGNLIANNANFANFAGIANSANSVTLANVSGAGNIAGINLDGNVANLLTGNGTFVAIPTVSANANFANFAGTAFNVSGSNVSGEVANANFAANAGNANIANTANSVAVANVSGIGNIATVNLDGNASNILYGNGAFSAAPSVSNVANANYANFAGTAFNVSGSNVSGEVANAAYANAANTANLATFATTANAVAGANVSGEVANANFASYANIASSANSVALANVVGIGNIANINLDGSSSNVLFGNGVFAPESTSIANANYANFAGTLINGNSNISFTAANGSIQFNPVGNANVARIDGNGSMFSTPLAGGYNNWLVISTNYGTTANGQNASRIGSFRYRGSSGANLSVQPNDGLMDLIALGYNGTALATSSGGRFKAIVDNSYVANGANIPVGWQVTVNDTVAGTTNIQKAHNFWANGNVTFANSVFVTDSLSVTGNITGGNITVGNITGVLANGTSNVSIPTANGTIAFSVNNTANLMLLENGGLVNAFPTSSVINMLRINTFNNSLTDAHRIAWARARGSNTSPTSVQAFDRLGILSFFGHNGTSYQTNSISLIRATVDGSYTANTANIPIGLQLIVNDTNGGVNNQAKTHNFYSNGTVSFANSISVSGNGNISGTNISASGQLNGNTSSILNQLTVGNNGATSSQVFITGDKTINSQFRIAGSPFTSIMDNVDPTTGYSPFFFNTYENANTNIPPSRYFRAKGTEASPAAVTTSDVVQLSSYAVYADSGNTYKDVFNTSVVVTSNDGVGNVTADYVIQGFNANSKLNILTNNTVANNFNASGNLNVGSGNAIIYGNGYISTNNEIDYLRTFGSFTSNVTQTNSNVGNAVYMTLNNDEGSNGVSIVSSSQITVARTGRYNLQFSAQLEKTDGGTDQVEIWLTKNGSAVANSATQLELKGSGAKDVAAWNWVDNVTTANTYYQIAWGSSDANAQLTAIPSANTLSGVAIPSLIVTVVPVGA